MKKIFNLFVIAVLGVSVTSCKKSLDINKNTNQATSATPELILPQAMTAVANQNWGFNFYGAQTVGYVANGGGVGGWGAIVSYNYASTDQQARWNDSYDAINDLQYVIDNTEGIASYAQFNAAAKVMKAYAFQRLVDLYGDLPYSQAFKGSANVTPVYDKAEVVYKNLADLLDNAIATFKANATASTQFKTADVMFNGSTAAVEVQKWIRFANTLKLRLVIRGGAKPGFANTTFDATGFLDDDAQINPGYTKADGKQNPFWNAFAYSFANAAVAAGQQYAPTPFVFAFYNGTKLTDPARRDVTYKIGATTPTNQLGFQEATAGRGQAPNSWFIGTSATAYSSQGIFKGPDAPQPMILLAESYFLQAEAAMKGLITGNAKDFFDQGIAASFRYMYKTSTNTVAAGKNPTTDATAYQAANATSYLANYNLATTNDQRLEAIITQKYIAFNMLFGDEAWNEYRRTGYPTSVVGTAAASAPANQTIVSLTTESTAQDKLPARLQYPTTEFQYNAANVPAIDKYTTKLFWAK